MQKGLADLISYEVSKACQTIEHAVSKYIALCVLLKKHGGLTQALKPLKVDMRRQRETVREEWERIVEWLQCRTKTRSRLSRFVRAWCNDDLARITVDALMKRKFPWEIKCTDLPEALYRVRRAQVKSFYCITTHMRGFCTCAYHYLQVRMM